MTWQNVQSQVLLNALDLAALASKVESAQALARQTARWKNPVLAATPLTGEQDYALTQEIDLWGKRASAARLAQAEAQVQAEGLEQARLNAVLEAATDFWTAVTAERVAALRQEELGLQDKLAGIREQEVQLGAFTEAELATLQRDTFSRRQSLVALSAQKASALAALYVLMGRPVTTPLRLDPAGGSYRITEGLDQLMGRALAASPSLRQARAKLTANGYRIESERRKWLPSVEAGPAAKRTTGGGSKWEPGAEVSFSIPLWDQNRSGVRAATLEGEGLARSLQSEQLKVAQDVFSTYQELQAVGRQLADFDRSLLPATSQRLERAAQQFKDAKLSERDFLSLRIDWLRQRQEREMLRMRQGLAASKLALLEVPPQRSPAVTQK